MFFFVIFQNKVLQSCCCTWGVPGILCRVMTVTFLGGELTSLVHFRNMCSGCHFTLVTLKFKIVMHSHLLKSYEYCCFEKAWWKGVRKLKVMHQTQKLGRQTQTTKLEATLPKYSENGPCETPPSLTCSQSGARHHFQMEKWIWRVVWLQDFAESAKQN